MTLRADIVSAYDEIAPPAPHLEAEIRTAVADDARITSRRRRRGPWITSFRGGMALVATLLVVFIAAATLVGVRLSRDRNSPPLHAPQVNMAELKMLESRPLHLPVVLSGAACRVGPVTNVSANAPEYVMYGQGPVYSGDLGFEQVRTEWGTWSKLWLRVDTSRVSGPVLLRARDLPTNQIAVFARYPSNPIGLAGDGIPSGGVVGSDLIYGATEQMYPELVLDSSRPYAATPKGQWPGYINFMGYPKKATGCIGVQVDGFTAGGGVFTETFVISSPQA